MVDASRRSFIKKLALAGIGTAAGLYAAQRYFNFLDLGKDATAFVTDVNKLIDDLGRPCAGGISIYLGNANKLVFDYPIGESLDSGLHKFLSGLSDENKAEFKLVYLKPKDFTNFEHYKGFENYLDSLAGSVKSNYEKFLPQNTKVSVLTEVKEFDDPSRLMIESIPSIVEAELGDYLYQPCLLNFITPSNMHGIVCNSDIDILGVSYEEGTFNNLGSNISFSEVFMNNGYVWVSETAKIITHELGHLLGMQHCWEDSCFMSYNPKSVDAGSFGSRCNLIGGRFSGSRLETASSTDGYTDSLILRKADSDVVKSDYESHLVNYLNDAANLDSYNWWNNIPVVGTSLGPGYSMESGLSDDLDISTFHFNDLSGARVYIDYYLKKAEVI